MPVIQNISIPAGDDIELTFDLDNDALVTLNEGTIYWNVYEQSYGIADGVPVLTCSTATEILIPASPSDVFIVTLLGSRTKGMLHNYYHEAFIEDMNGQKFTLTTGILTVTPTKIASAQ